ncbi:Serine carboxypeptidase-like [Trichinella spiralis]|uniref:Serine carboxypeptidase-like n=1 Tax=Trichinella spiralis TaxID=6334 RepID=A0ABR3KJK9_TRISP
MPAFATSTRHHFPVKCLCEEQAAACLGKYFKRFLNITCPLLSSKIRDEQFQSNQKIPMLSTTAQQATLYFALCAVCCVLAQLDEQ